MCKSCNVNDVKVIFVSRPRIDPALKSAHEEEIVRAVEESRAEKLAALKEA